jgi:hypothetical protein
MKSQRPVQPNGISMMFVGELCNSHCLNIATLLLCSRACSILRVTNSNWMARPTSHRSVADDT